MAKLFYCKKKLFKRFFKLILLLYFSLFLPAQNFLFVDFGKVFATDGELVKTKSEKVANDAEKTLEKRQEEEQKNKDFSKGVLALNTNKYAYFSGENVFVQMAALDEKGDTLCHAKLELRLKMPNGEEIFPEIQKSSTCGDNNVTNSPDYFSNFKADLPGEYFLTLKNLETEKEISTSFGVFGQIPYEIEREAATRINPFKAKYEMKIKVRANLDFLGVIKEKVQKDFEITPKDEYKVREDKNGKSVNFAVSLKKGEEKVLAYEFDAPHLSPEFFLAGGLQFLKCETPEFFDVAPHQMCDALFFEETRGWQIASDATITSTSTGGNWNAGATWVGGATPAPTDNVVIATTGSNRVLQNIGGTGATVADITINSGSILLSGTNPLRVTGNYTNNGTHSGTNNANSTITILGNSAVISGSGTTTSGVRMLMISGSNPSFGNLGNLTIGSSITVGASVTVTNNGEITLLSSARLGSSGVVVNNVIISGSAPLAGAGSIIQGTNSTLRIGVGGTVAITTLDATATGNTVDYNLNGAQTCKVTQYYNLSLSNGGAKTCALTSNVLGDVTLTAGAGVPSWTLTTAFTINGDLSIGTGTTLQTGAVALTVSGQTDVSGTFNLVTGAGAKTLTGLVTVNSGGNLFGASTGVVVGAGIVNNGTVNVTGRVTVNSPNTVLTANSDMNITNMTVNTAGTVTISGSGILNSGTVAVISAGSVTNNGNVVINGNFTGTGVWTQGENSNLSLRGATTNAAAITTLNATANGNTVTYNSNATQTIKLTDYYHLTFSGTGAGRTIPSGTINIAGNLSVGTTLSQTNNPTIIVGGDVTGSGGRWVQGTQPITVGGDWALDGVFIASAAGVNLTGNGKEIIGPSSGLTFTNLNVSGSYTNSSVGTLTISTIVTGGGVFVQGVSSNLNIGGTVSVSTFSAGATGNTVRYTATSVNQTVKGAQYFNLVIDKTGRTALLSGSVSTGGDLTISAGTLDADNSGNYAIYVGGNWTNSGTFLPRAGTVTFTGNSSSNQTLTTGGISQAFYHLGLNNTQGTYDHVVVNGDLTVGGNLTLTDGVLDLSVNNPAIYLSGNLSISSSGGFEKGTGLFVFNGSSQTISDSTSLSQDLGKVSIGPSTTTSVSTSTNVKMTSVVVGGNDTFDISGDILNLTGDQSPLTVTTGGTFTVTSSTVRYSNSTGAYVYGGTYNNLEFNPSSGSPVYLLANPGSWFDANWGYRKKITIDKTKVSGSLTNFPVLVSLTDNDLKTTGNGGHVGKSNGGDIVFTSSDGTTKLNHEIESYSATTGVLVAWVNVPSVTSSADTDIYIYYGNSGASDQWNVSAVWGSDYRAVWHLGENSGTVYDSTSNGNNSSSQTITDQTASGKINGADYFNGGSDGITFPDSSGSLTLVGSTAAVTLSIWVNSSEILFGQYKNIIAKNVTDGDANYYVSAYGGELDFGWYNSGWIEHKTTTLNMTTGTWYYIVCTFDDASDTAKIYVNGQEVYSTTSETNSMISFPSGQTAKIGYYYGTSETYIGYLDEARISSVAKSASWVSTEYNNQNSPGTFYSVGIEESPGGGGGISSLDVLGNLTIGNGSQSVIFSGSDPDSTISVSGNVMIYANSTFSAPSSTASDALTVAGNWTNNGFFVANSGRVTFNGGAQTISGSSTSPYYQLYIIGTTTRTVTVNSGTHIAVSSGGTLHLEGAASNILSLASNDTNDWFLEVSNTSTTVYVRYTRPSYSNANGFKQIDATDSSNQDGGNNHNWLFSSANQNPNSPISLVQAKTDDTVIATGTWVSTTTIKFSATASDQDASDTIYLCVEKKDINTAFSGTEDSCGSGVSYSGSPVTVSVTISGLTDDTAYHWQARVKDAAGAYSSWVSYGGNSDTTPGADRDFGLDTSAPTGGTVYDGLVNAVDATFNDGSLSSLSANWSGVNANASGLKFYEYSVGTGVGASNVHGWTNVGVGTSVLVTGLTLQTSQVYYFNIRTTDNAGNVSTISSNGQLVAPSLSFALGSTSVSFDNLNPGNSYSDTKSTTLTTSTNAYGGYVVRAYQTDELRSVSYPSQYISSFSGGTYAAPSGWTGGSYGFGYTSSDTSIQGSAKFPNSGSCLGTGTAPCFAPFNFLPPGDIVADHTANVSGSPITNEVFTITYKVAVSSSQAAGRYSTAVVYTVSPQY